MKNSTLSCTISFGMITMGRANMIGRRTLLILLFIATAISAAHAQVNCSSGSSASGKLACLIPGALASAPPGYTVPGPSASSSNSNFNQFQNSFNFLTADLGGELSQIPLASPASGVIFVIDPTLKVPVPSDQSLGPILTQRADTIGRHKIYVASTYQYFLLKDVDGGSLQSLPPTAFFLNSSSSTGAPDTLSVANGRIDLKIHQFVGYVTFGLTDFADVSVAVPVLRVQMRYTFSEALYKQSGIQPAFQGTKAGEATGIGDVVLAYKERVWKGKHAGLSFGAEVRLPTGDAENFLGSGTFGIKPFVTFTRSGKISPHFNLGYQFNGNTKLVTDSAGHETRLPGRLVYSGGADWGIVKRLTIAADVLEQRVFNSPRATTNPNSISPFPSPNTLTLSGLLASQNGSYNRTDGSIGLKLKPFANVLVTGNLLVKLDRNGLRERYAPLVGVSFTY